MKTTKTDYVRLLEQDEIWIDARGVENVLADMDPHHRANLIPFLRRRAAVLQYRASIAYWRSDLSTSDSDGLAYLQMKTEIELSDPPEDWLERKPLMRKLVEYEKGRTFLERKSTHIRNKLYEARHPT